VRFKKRLPPCLSKHPGGGGARARRPNALNAGPTPPPKSKSTVEPRKRKHYKLLPVDVHWISGCAPARGNTPVRRRGKKLRPRCDWRAGSRILREALAEPGAGREHRLRQELVLRRLMALITKNRTSAMMRKSNIGLDKEPSLDEHFLARGSRPRRSPIRGNCAHELCEGRRGMRGKSPTTEETIFSEGASDNPAAPVEHNCLHRKFLNSHLVPRQFVSLARRDGRLTQCTVRSFFQQADGLAQPDLCEWRPLSEPSSEHPSMGLSGTYDLQRCRPGL